MCNSHGRHCSAQGEDLLSGAFGEEGDGELCLGILLIFGQLDQFCGLSFSSITIYKYLSIFMKGFS